MSKFGRIFWLAPVLLLLTGCGGKYDAKVSGVVTLDGAPLPRGTIVFFPAAAGPSAHGRSDETGSYSLSTGREPGLPSGDYFVTVVASEPAVVPDNWSGPPPPGELITPERYGSKGTSGLQYTVEAGRNDIAIDLVSTE